MESGYQQEPVGGGRVRFTVSPAPAPRPVGAAFSLAAVSGLIVLGLPLPPGGLGAMALRLAVAAPAGFWVYRSAERWLSRRAERVRVPGGTFVVSPSGIEAGGSILPREHLLRLLVTNAVPGAVGPTIVDAGSVYHGAPTGRASGPPARRAGAAAVSYMLCAEASGGPTILAGGMTDRTAHGLLTEVSRILSLG